MPAKKFSVSIPESLHLAATKRQKAFGYEKFSHYVQECIRAEVESESNTIIRHAKDTPAPQAPVPATPIPPPPRRRTAKR